MTEEMRNGGYPEGTEKQSRHSSLAAKLVICVGKAQLQAVPVTDDIILGQEQKEGYLGIPSGNVMPDHGRLVRQENGFAYEDLQGKGCTYLNDLLVSPENFPGMKQIPLSDGDVLRFEPSGGTSGPEERTVLLYRRRYVENAQWRELKLDQNTSRYYISRHEEKTGPEEAFREESVITELPRHYGILSCVGGKWTLRDNNTRHGVYLNNHKISEETPLKEMDVIRIGDTLFLFRDGKLEYSHEESAQNRLSIHIEERSVWDFFRKKILLEDISLTIDPGEMVLILGGSGAGKTTFINAVMGYEKAKGTIKEGDRDIYRNYNQMKYEIGFVPQQDLLREDDTVYDTLDNAAEMKLPVSLDKDSRKARIEQVLELMGLEREKDSLVEKLSGGQRRRLSIAVEFIADPSLFFLDEPDSGLDGIMARTLMENLRRIADENKIVIVITHSPDRAADLFDKVVVLAKSQESNVGRLAFYGMIDEAKEFFGTDSLEGIVKRINREDEGGDGLADEFIKKYKELEEK